MQELIKQADTICFMLPPRSHDMHPVDYPLLGHAKSWLAREIPPGVITWDKRCDAFTGYLRGLGPFKEVGSFEWMLEQVVATQGGRSGGACKSRTATERAGDFMETLVGNSVSPHARPFNRQWPMRQRRRPWRWIAIGRSSFHPAESRRTGPLGVSSCRYVTLYSWTVV